MKYGFIEYCQRRSNGSHSRFCRSNQITSHIQGLSKDIRYHEQHRCTHPKGCKLTQQHSKDSQPSDCRWPRKIFYQGWCEHVWGYYKHLSKDTQYLHACSSNAFWNHATGRVLNEELYTHRIQRYLPVFLQHKWSGGVIGWISDSYCSIKPLCSGMVEVVPARTSPTLLPPSLALCCDYPVWKCPSASIVVTSTVRVNTIKGNISGDTPSSKFWFHHELQLCKVSYLYHNVHDST